MWSIPLTSNGITLRTNGSGAASRPHAVHRRFTTNGALQRLDAARSRAAPVPPDAMDNGVRRELVIDSEDRAAQVLTSGVLPARLHAILEHKVAPT